MEFLEYLFGIIGDLTWGWSLIPILVVLGVFITLATGFVQLRYFRRMFRVLRNDANADPDKISARAALLVSVGGRVGGGNIAGVAVAITLGGPGLSSGCGPSLWSVWPPASWNSSLAQLYKTRVSGSEYRGGPARVIMHGLGADYKWLAVIYAVCLMAAFGFGFNAFQGNTVAGAMQDSFGIDRLYTGAALAVMSGFIIFGGIHRIARASDIVVPVMAFGYILMAVLAILLNIGELPGVIISIVSNAFGFEQAVGGGMGAALAQGLRRGLFSNEAGLGSAPNIAATAEVRHPVSQGVTQSFSVFIDTIVICSCTAFVILLGDVYQPGAEGIDGVVLTQQSMVSHFGEWASYFLSISILLFAFSSIIYNYYLGENALAVLSGHPMAVNVLRVAIVGVVFLGAVAPGATSVFFFSDPMMGILALVNLMVIMMMFPVASRLLRDFRSQLEAGIARPVLNPDDYADLDIDRTAWTGKVPNEASAKPVAAG